MIIRRLKKLLFLHLQHLPMKSRGWRSRICKWGGVNILDPKHTFIGEDVIFDTNYPQDITIESGVTLTARSVLVTHIVEVDSNAYRHYSRGKIIIKKKAYIGTNTVICKPVTIGEGASGSFIRRDEGHSTI